MRERLEKIIAAYQELEQKLMDPAVVSNPKEYARLAKEHASQGELVTKAREYLQALDDIEAAKEMLHEAADADEKTMLQEDISANEEKLPALEEDIKFLLIPADPNDEKDTIVEIRAASTPSSAASTRTSVSGRGMSTPFSQRRTMWRKGISPVTYWRGSPAARRSMPACMRSSSSGARGRSKLT